MDIRDGTVTAAREGSQAPAEARAESHSRHTQRMNEAAGVAGTRPEWLAAQRSYELERLDRVLRNPSASTEEKSIAQAQADHWRKTGEIACGGEDRIDNFACRGWTPMRWVPVMDRTVGYLLAKDLAVTEGYRSMRRAGRWVWSREDYRVAVATFLALWPASQDSNLLVVEWSAT